MAIFIEDWPYPAFEANEKLCQSKTILFGLTNAVPCFQRIIIDDIIEHNNCKGALHTLITLLFVARPKENTIQIFSIFLK